MGGPEEEEAEIVEEGSEGKSGVSESEGSRWVRVRVSYFF